MNARLPASAARLALAALTTLGAAGCGRPAAEDAGAVRLAAAETAVPEGTGAASHPTAAVGADGRVRLAGERLDPRDPADAARGAALLAERAREMPTVRAFVDDVAQGPPLPAHPLRLAVDRAAPWGAVRATVALGRDAGLFRYDLLVHDPRTGRTARLDLELERARPEEGAAGRPEAPLFALAEGAGGAWAVRRGARGERSFADAAELRAALAALEGIDPETRLVRLDAPAGARWERVAPLVDELRRARLRVWLAE